ncbi:hypothetical protein BGZ70_006277 [Mortierella alpina]|uniref:N-acetyltransferase domain-containing protein n=1 Tax=Mortierella alpina TaxID=64518 RepID=A0A9P6M701_MORAP|nr:hypothetical protein BGZ70_006277 [Mortierella alpina]
MDAPALPSRHSVIKLRNITADNWGHIARLVVNKDQLGLVSSNLESLCEHQFHQPQSKVWAVYADNSPVGFIRLQRKQDENSSRPVYFLKTFMIDQACQGLGFGTKAMRALREELLGHHMQQTEIRVSTTQFATVRQDDSPVHFFTALGFESSSNASEQQLVWLSIS